MESQGRHDTWRITQVDKAALPMLKLSVTIEGNMTKPINQMRAVHPGEVLREDFLIPLGMSVNALAIALSVPATRLHEIVKERRSVTADTAERLARYFGGDAASWLVMQANYDLKTLVARAEITKNVHPREMAVA
jgi:addiction module HigA family antidote